MPESTAVCIASLTMSLSFAAIDDADRLMYDTPLSIAYINAAYISDALALPSLPKALMEMIPASLFSMRILLMTLDP